MKSHCCTNVEKFIKKRVRVRIRMSVRVGALLRVREFYLNLKLNLEFYLGFDSS
jgi:hypothetical protein